MTQPEFTEHAIRYFEAKNWAALATLRNDGTAHVSPMWIDWDGEYPCLNMAVGCVKDRHIRRDPRVTVQVADQEDPQLGYIEVTGRAELVEDGADKHIDALARKYLGTDYPWRGPDEKRVIIRVIPERIFARGGAVGGPPRALAEDKER